jgi:hypothetical protein
MDKINAHRAPLSPDHAETVRANPHLGWDQATLDEARAMAGGLTAANLDPAELGRMAEAPDVAPGDAAGLGRMMHGFGAMHADADARAEAALGRWIGGAGFVAALLIGAAWLAGWL